MDDEIISGFLAAFNTFSTEIFSKSINRLTFGEYIILMEPISNYTVCYIIKGNIIIARQKLSQFTQQIQNDALILQTLNEFRKKHQVVDLKEIPSLKKILFSTSITTHSCGSEWQAK
ncbi:MAG: hypothetical protein ACFFEY_20745 [Candidatus Thorarchaeota archaeon]